MAVSSCDHHTIVLPGTYSPCCQVAKFRSPSAGVAALLALMLQDDEAGDPALGPVHCITIGSAASMSRNLADGCREHVTSIILGCVAVCVWRCVVR